MLGIGILLAIAWARAVLSWAGLRFGESWTYAELGGAWDVHGLVIG
jgi:hypothetical protein